MVVSRAEEKKPKLPGEPIHAMMNAPLARAASIASHARALPLRTLG